MRKERSKTIGRSLPWGLIGMLGLLMTVEKIVVRHDLDLTGIVPLNWRYARNKAVSEARNCAILCLGYSIVKFGICPSLIEAETGKRTFNLAMSWREPARQLFRAQAGNRGRGPAGGRLDRLPGRWHRTIPDSRQPAELSGVAQGR